MCTFREVKETRSIGDAEYAAQHGDAEGYVNAAGLAGDDARAAARTDPGDPNAGYNPLSKLGTFAMRTLPSIGAGGMKNLNPTTAATDPYASLAIKRKV